MRVVILLVIFGVIESFAKEFVDKYLLTFSYIIFTFKNEDISANFY